MKSLYWTESFEVTKRGQNAVINLPSSFQSSLQCPMFFSSKIRKNSILLHFINDSVSWLLGRTISGFEERWNGKRSGTSGSEAKVSREKVNRQSVRLIGALITVALPSNIPKRMLPRKTRSWIMPTTCNALQRVGHYKICSSPKTATTMSTPHVGFGPGQRTPYEGSDK